MKPAALVVIVATCQPAPSAPTGPHWCWPERPVHVFVSSDLPVQCQQAVCDAVEWWRSRGVDYLTCAVSPALGMVRNVPTMRIINVFEHHDGDAGRTFISRVTQQCIAASQMEIAVDRCQPGMNTAAHELGHALGLEHVSDMHNLMYFSTVGGWGLDKTQLDHVR